MQIFKLIVHELLAAGNGVSSEQFENIRDFLRDQTLKDQYTFLSFDQYEDQQVKHFQITHKNQITFNLRGIVR